MKINTSILRYTNKIKTIKSVLRSDKLVKYTNNNNLMLMKKKIKCSNRLTLMVKTKNNNNKNITFLINSIEQDIKNKLFRKAYKNITSLEERVC